MPDPEQGVVLAVNSRHVDELKHENGSGRERGGEHTAEAGVFETLEQRCETGGFGGAVDVLDLERSSAAVIAGERASGGAGVGVDVGVVAAGSATHPT